MTLQIIESEYRRLCAAPSDINEHLPLLRHTAEGCRHVTEFGMRAGVSTVALIAARPEMVVTYDIDPKCLKDFERLALIKPAGTNIEFVRADTTKAVIEQTDFLFIDALHTADNVRAEVEHNEFKVSRYIGFHDTETFGMQGEDGKAPGILTPIMELVRSGRWELIEHRRNNNGLIILKRREK